MKTIVMPAGVVGTLMLTFGLIFTSCKKDQLNVSGEIPAGKTKLSVYLSDGPMDFQNVFIDIQQIAVKLDTCRRNWDDDTDQPGCDDDHDRRNSSCEVWDTLNIKPGVYDILQLRNGLDTLLASDFVLNGKIQRLKFTIGDNNSVTVDGVTHPLNLTGSQHFVYLNLKREHFDSVTANNLQLYLDFNLAKSVKYINGNYWLKPVLKPFGRHSTGEIEGKVRPVFSYGLIRAYNATDTAYAMPWNQGEFKIRGLKEGTYSLYVQGINGYKDTTITNIAVRRSSEAEVGTIQLRR
jgi:hypothetical protein